MSPSCCGFTKGTSPVLITTHRHTVTKGTSLRINHNSSSCCFHERGTSLRYQSQLIIMFSRKHVPPCYQSQLIIMLCFHERHVPPCYQSQLIIIWFSRKARPSVHQSQLIIMLCFTKGTSLRAINHNSSS
jgi:hypothetical protein